LQRNPHGKTIGAIEKILSKSKRIDGSNKRLYSNFAFLFLRPYYAKMLDIFALLYTAQNNKFWTIRTKHFMSPVSFILCNFLAVLCTKKTIPSKKFRRILSGKDKEIYKSASYEIPAV
jgi:hypothetical protein